MSSVTRGIKNVFRNKMRTIVVILIIGLSIAVFLSMSIVSANISENTSNISDDLETTITIRPAGSFGPISTDTMNESVITDIELIDHIESIQKLITIMEMDQSGSIDKRMITMIEGLDPGEDILLFTGGSISIISGRTLNSGDSDEYVAIIGTEYADENNADVGDTIYLNGESFEVVGEFETGNRIGDRTVIVPYDAAKEAYDVDGMNMLYVSVDTIGNMDSVEKELKDVLGSDYDVIPVSEMGGASMQESIDSISSTSELGSLVALLTAAVVMIFVMILVTKERIKEIGILKAIGFKNSKIIKQFFTESVVLASIGYAVGIVLTLFAGPYLANVFLGTSTTSSTTGMSMGPKGSGTTDIISSIDFSLSLDLMLYTLILAVVLGIIGSLYPIMKAIKLKPAEALRYDE